MSLSIQGKTAIVTGAGRGIGLAIGQYFVERGANVVFADKDEAALDQALEEYGSDNRQVRRFAGDLVEKLALANLLSTTIDAFDRVDILVNAHRQMKRGDALDTDTDLVDQMLRQNLLSAHRLSQLVAKRMIRQSEEATETGEAGAIVNLTTMAADRPTPSMLAFSIASAAQEQATRGLALVLAPHRIRVNGIRFGSVMSHDLQAALKEKPDQRDLFIQGTPLGRIASPDELVETVQYLVSDAARFVTGQILTVDGGRSLIDPVAAQLF
ncbi:SDR family oxidoreductase [Paracoccus caeni]|uniref:SDR family oxidoreductase n=1 Tax=Paracoccus caeni TaxID=657651 RepID=A0A934W0P7_9RHOB|nr:SDR family oxidoreductase [Paracoccus caeni]MBK4217170.1 SDR family oxidoreductase [Paracoccus caeni]